MREIPECEILARHGRLLMRVFTLTRAAILVQLLMSLVATWRSVAHPAIVVGVIAALVAESAAVVVIHAQRGRVRGHGLAVADVCFGLAALGAVVAVMRRSANPDTDNVLYPYTVASMAVIGIVFRRLPGVLIITALAAGTYITATVWRFGFSPALVDNSLTYGLFACLSWVLAVRFRRLSTDLEQARRTAIAREGELASERERSRLSRDLHDRVLQTLEFVGREAWISDPEVRDHVAAEAVWLRALVHGELGHGEPGHGEPGRAAHGLAAELDDVAAAQARTGMRVEVNTAGLRTGSLAPEVTAAVRGAVTELLTNVRKHSGTCRAVLRAVSGPGRVTVTVLDHGSGFDPARASGGVGLRESVAARIRQAGGDVAITSEPGAGTHAEIWVPALGPPDDPPPGEKVHCPVSA